jgi:hypothetical protein
MRVGKPTDLLQGTLDLLILKTMALEPMHGWAIAQRIRQVSKDVLLVNQGGALPGVAPTGEQWVDSGRVGRVREQPEGKVLLADARREEVHAGRRSELGEVVGGDRNGAEGEPVLTTGAIFFWAPSPCFA